MERVELTRQLLKLYYCMVEGDQEVATWGSPSLVSLALADVCLLFEGSPFTSHPSLFRAL